MLNLHCKIMNFNTLPDKLKNFTRLYITYDTDIFQMKLLI